MKRAPASAESSVSVTKGASSERLGIRCNIDCARGRAAATSCSGRAVYAGDVRIALSNPDVGLDGGVERVITEAANRLTQMGHAVTVYAARVQAGVLDPNVRVEHVAVPARVDAYTGLGFRGRCAAAIAADRPDVHGAFSALSPLGGVFWVPSVHRIGYELLLSRRGLGGRLAVSLHPYHRGRLWLERSMFAPGGAAGLLAQTEAVRSDIARCYPGARDIGVLPLGYDDVMFEPHRRRRLRDQARRRFGYAPEERVFLFVANELERKGFDVLLAAAAQMPEAKILGAGRRAPSRQLVERAGLGDRLQWAGHVSDVAALQAAADALVLPTRYEPWGLVIVEALGSGLPVVTSRLAGAAGAVRDGQTGSLLDDPEDTGRLVEAMRWAISDGPAPPDEIAASVHAYAWDQVIERYAQALIDASVRG
jgi:UDP-glucose:(heptosyl)LPS alpha-1,3-glucosyltransferase